MIFCCEGTIIIPKHSHIAKEFNVYCIFTSYLPHAHLDHHHQDKANGKADGAEIVRNSCRHQ